MKIVSNNPFRNSNNVYLLQGLFIETGTPELAVYTLQDHDRESYPSLYRLYMETADLTEYTFAKEHLDGWEHWQRLTNSEFFKPYASRWREELELSYRSKALAQIIHASKAGGKDAFQASKFLVDKGWAPKEPSSGRGRPSKSQISSEAKRIAEDEKKLQSDFLRIIK